MAIFTALALMIPLVILAAIVEGMAATIKKSREKRTWKMERAAYYPKCYYY